jgi:hypothetical protein
MKSLSAALAALSLAFAAGTSAAAPVSLSFSNDSIQSAGDQPASFNDVFGFGLDAQTLLSGVVTTHSPEVNGPWVNITSAFIQAQAGGPVFDLTETQAVNWDADEFGVEIWTFDPRWLAAGDWELHVIGEGYGTKQPEGYTADLSGRSVDLPEPAALALVAIALAGMGLSRRRSR